MFKRVIVGIALSVAFEGCGGPPADIEFTSVTPEHPQLNQIAVLVFSMTDYRGVPLAGTPVSFSLANNVPGVSLNPTSAVSDKGTGEVRTELLATAGVGSVQVIANAGGGKIALSPQITFAGSVANGRQLTFQCGSFGGPVTGGIHAIGAYDPDRYLIAGTEVDCFAHVGDRNGDSVPLAEVAFLTEAGTISPSATTSADDEGATLVTYKITYPLPHPTDPGVFVDEPVNDAMHTGDTLVPLWMDPHEWVKNPLGNLLTSQPVNPASLVEPQRLDPLIMDGASHRVNNPRDNLVAIIAVTNGEEGFTDMNANGKYDTGEPFDDLTEPFVDSNDNGTWDGPTSDTDLGEKFIDTNGNGVWDGKNGKWDAQTQIWVQERITWTGVPYQASQLGVADDYNNLLNGASPTVSAAQIGFMQPPPPVRIHCNEQISFHFPIADPWWNTLAQNSQGDGCDANPGLGMMVVNAQGAFHGIFFDYPPIRDYAFIVSDALPRMPAPMTDTPGCFEAPAYSEVMFPPIPFYVVVNCKFTASPKAGYVTTIATTVSGLISRNSH